MSDNSYVSLNSDIQDPNPCNITSNKNTLVMTFFSAYLWTRKPQHMGKSLLACIDMYHIKKKPFIFSI